MISTDAPVSMKNFNDFFLENFEIKFQSPHQTKWSNRRVILLGEDHTDLVFRRNYSALIDSVSKTRNIVALVEGERLMTEINKKASAQTCFISSNITIYGWDESTPQERYPHLPQIDECTKLYLNYELKLLESEGESDPQTSEKLKKEARDILANFYAVEQQLDQHAYKDAVRESFPKRTEAMINTIKQVITLHPESMIIVIAGRNHVYRENHDDPRFSLDALYRYLNTIESMTLIARKDEECTIM